MPRVNKPHKFQRPKSLSGFTQAARGATFQQLTRGLGTGQRVASSVSFYPFTGRDAAKWYRRTKMLDATARAWVARALREPYVRSKVSGNTGTVPELVVVGRFLSHGFKLHRTLFFQEVALHGFRLTKAFVADIAISTAGGALVLLPIDGRYFHARTLRQQLDAQKRNRALSRLGRVVPIPDTETTNSVRLNAFLKRQRVAA